jgi:hypothetical protein
VTFTTIGFKKILVHEKHHVSQNLYGSLLRSEAVMNSATFIKISLEEALQNLYSIVKTMKL